MIRRLALVVLLGTGIGAAPQAGQTLSFEASADTTLSESGPGTNFGTATTDTADGGAGTTLVTLLKWDLSAIPPGSVVISAQLELHVVNTSSEGYELYRMARTWNEDEATWTQAETGSAWDLPGASGANDHGFSVRGIVQAGAIGVVAIDLSAEGVTAVQAWVDGPSVNYGFILCDGVNTDGLAFASRESATASQRPKLTVTFMPSSGSAAVVPNGGSGFCGATGMEAALLVAFVALLRRICEKK